jgi:hypothetical protein
MPLSTVQEIERAIQKLSPAQQQELYSWFDQNYPQLIDTRIESDLAAGRLDKSIDRALNDDKHGRIRPL